MSEPTLSPLSDAPRPLPRRGLPSSPRALRPRFQSLDAFWMFILAGLTLGIAFYIHGTEVFQHRACIQPLVLSWGFISWAGARATEPQG